MMRHLSMQITQIYAKITKQKVIDDMKILSNRIENSHELLKNDMLEDFGKNQHYKLIILIIFQNLLNLWKLV